MAADALVGSVVDTLSTGAAGLRGYCREVVFGMIRDGAWKDYVR